MNSHIVIHPILKRIDGVGGFVVSNLARLHLSLQSRRLEDDDFTKNRRHTYSTS